jgi:outer membrane immunogenic protein
MKKQLVILLSLVLISGLVFGAAKKSLAADTFSEGGFYLSPMVGLNSYTIPFGLNVEYGVTPNIGIGGTVMYWGWSEPGYSYSIIGIEAEATYHFVKEIKVEKFDFYAGVGIGYNVFSSNVSGFSTGYGSGVFFDPFAAARYYFSDKIALLMKLHIGFGGSFGGVGGSAGVTFKL